MTISHVMKYSQIILFLCLGFQISLSINPLEIEAIYSEVQDANANAHPKNNVSNNTSRLKRSSPVVSDAGVGEDVEIPPPNYRRYELPPTENDSPTIVNISIIVMNVRDIQESEEDISIEMNMRTYWIDKRLSSALTNVSNQKTFIIQPELIEKLWHPDLFIDHVKSINQPTIMSRPASLKIYPDTMILRYSTRLTVQLSCSFNFRYYPADSQTCNVDIKSYAYPSNKMMLQWKESREGKGASFAYELQLGNYWVRMENPDTFALETSSGTYSGLRFSIILTRNMESHILQTYAPSCLLVFLSWITFCIHIDEFNLRAFVSTSLLILLGIMFGSVRQSVPNVSYIKAIDIWMIGCIFSVALVIVEVVLVIRIKKMKPKEPSTALDSSKDPFSDQNVGYNHFNALKGARGSVATVYYPGYNPQQRRMSTRPGVGVPGQQPVQLDESDEEYSTGSTGYIRRPSSIGESPAYTRRPTIVPGSVGDPQSRMYQRPLPNPMKQVQFQPPASAPPGTPSSRSQSIANLYQMNTANMESSKYTKIAHRVDIGFSIIIPILFLAFNFLYWPWLFGSSHYFSRIPEEVEQSS